MPGHVDWGGCRGRAWFAQEGRRSWKQRLVKTRSSVSVWGPRVCSQGAPLCLCPLPCHRSDLIYSSYDSSEVGLLITIHEETDAHRGKVISQRWGGPWWDQSLGADTTERGTVGASRWERERNRRHEGRRGGEGGRNDRIRHREAWLRFTTVLFSINQDSKEIFIFF